MTGFPDHAAHDYDTRIRRMVPGYALAQELAAGVLAAATPTPARLLFVGCGTAGEILAVAKTLPHAHLTGIDPSAGMIAVARERAEAAGLGHRSRFETTTLEAFHDPLRFDACMLSLVLHFLPDDGAKAALVGEIRKRLVTGGTFVLIDPVNDDMPPDTYAAWLATTGHDDEAVAAILERSESQWHRVSTARLAEIFTENGFTPPRLFFSALAYRGFVARAA